MWSREEAGRFPCVDCPIKVIASAIMPSMADSFVEITIIWEKMKQNWVEFICTKCKDKGVVGFVKR